MLKLYMLKKINILIFSILFCNSAIAKEPLLAILNDITSNEVQKFGVKNYTFKCKPYGVLTLERLYRKSKADSICRKNIEKFYKKNPKLRYYSEYILEKKQTYHLEIKETECILYAKGEMTLSELLLKEGLAVKQLLFKDEEFDSYFTLLQRKARMQKKGLWAEKIFDVCTKNLSK